MAMFAALWLRYTISITQFLHTHDAKSRLSTSWRKHCFLMPRCYIITLAPPIQCHDHAHFSPQPPPRSSSLRAPQSSPLFTAARALPATVLPFPGWTHKNMVTLFHAKWEAFRKEQEQRSLDLDDEQRKAVQRLREQYAEIDKEVAKMASL